MSSLQRRYRLASTQHVANMCSALGVSKQEVEVVKSSCGYGGLGVFERYNIVGTTKEVYLRRAKDLIED